MSGTKEARQEGIYCVWSSATGCCCILLPLTDGIFYEGWGNGVGLGGFRRYVTHTGQSDVMAVTSLCYSP